MLRFCWRMRNREFHARMYWFMLTISSSPERIAPKPSLLGLPNELLSKILALVTVESTTNERTFHRAPDRLPSKWLYAKLVKLAACKQLFYLAHDAHFSQNELTATLCTKIRCIERIENRRKFDVRVEVERGTFEEKPILFHRTHKLLVRCPIWSGRIMPSYINKIRDIAASCAVLSKLTIDLDNIQKDLADEFKAHINDIATGLRKARNKVIGVEFIGEARFKEKPIEWIKGLEWLTG